MSGPHLQDLFVTFFFCWLEVRKESRDRKCIAYRIRLSNHVANLGPGVVVGPNKEKVETTFWKAVFAGKKVV